MSLEMICPFTRVRADLKQNQIRKRPTISGRFKSFFSFMPDVLADKLPKPATARRQRCRIASFVQYAAFVKGSGDKNEI